LIAAGVAGDKFITGFRQLQYIIDNDTGDNLLPDTFG
jgi:hypothetical protein